MKSITEKIMCASCSGEMIANRSDYKSGGACYKCSTCGREYPVSGLIIDTVDGSERYSSGPSQRMMESPLLVFIYESIWRPLVTRPFSDLRWEIDQVGRYLRITRNCDVLDFASGTANFSRLFSGMLSGGLIVAADLSLPMLRRGLRYAKHGGLDNIVFARNDATSWVFRNDSFDRIICAGALHLFSDVRDFAGHAYSTLRPGGIFVGATYLKGDTERMIGTQKRISARSGIHWFTLDELKESFECRGFSHFECVTNNVGIVFRVEKQE